MLSNQAKLNKRKRNDIWRKKNPSKVRIYKNNWFKNNKEHIKQYRDNVKQAMIDILGGKCKRCGFTDIRALQVDHIQGDGHKDIAKKGKGGMYFKQVLRSVLNKENKYQLLCANCNWIKRFENNEVLNGRKLLELKNKEKFL